MSALAKPLNHFLGAVGSGLTTFIPAEQVISIEKVDIPANGTGNPATYWLHVTLATRVEPVKVKFLTAAARNIGYTNFVAANSAALAAT